MLNTCGENGHPYPFSVLGTSMDSFTAKCNLTIKLSSFFLMFFTRLRKFTPVASSLSLY